LVIGAISYYTPITTPSGYSVAASYVNGSIYAYLYYSANASAQSSVAFSTGGVSTIYNIIGCEYKGAVTTASPDKTATQTTAATTSPSTATTATTSQGNEVAVGFFANSVDSAVPSSATGGFSILAYFASPSVGCAYLDQLNCAVGTYTAGFSDSTSTTWETIIATFKV
jgi:hypothetical protein